LDASYGASTTNGLAGPQNPPFYGFDSTNRAVACKSTAISGGAGFVTAPPLNINTSSFSVAAWVYPFANITNGAGILFSRKSTYAVGLGYFAEARAPANEVGYTWNHTNSATYAWPSRLYTPPGQWSFVALTISPAQAVLYVATNGVLYASTNAIAHTTELWDGPTSIGADMVSAGSRVFNGKLDEVAVFDYTLSQAQVADLYLKALTGGPVTLGCQVSGTNVLLNWEHGKLLASPNPDGPWTPVPSAAPPSFNTSPTDNVFYRVQVYP
jgi:hypothetical protein